MEREDIKADLKSAYGELKRFGTRLADTGRDWWQQRRTEMNQRYEHEQDDRNRGENRSQEYWQRGRQAARGGEDQEHYGLSGRQSSYYRNDERRYDMGGSGVRGQQGGHGYTEDYSAGASGRGGRQWDDDDEPWRYSQRSYQTGGDAYSPRAADYSGGAYGMPAMGTGSRYTGSAYQGPYGEEYGYGQDEFRTRGQGSYGQRTGGRSGYGEYGDAPYGQSASMRPNQQRYGGQRRYGERSGYDVSAQYGQSGYGYGQNRSEEMPMGMGSAAGNYGRSGYGAEQDRGQRFGQESFGRGSYGAQGRYQGYGPRNYTRSDERITEELNERLTDDPDIDAGDINVRVSNGMVTLEGTVDDRWMKHRAEDIADSCSGVKDVTNSIRVVSRNERSGEFAGSLGGTSEASDTSTAGKTTGRTGTGESTTTRTPHH